MADVIDAELVTDKGDDPVVPARLAIGKIGGLNVRSPQDNLPHLNLMIYGDSGVGKTLLAGTAAFVPELTPMLFVDVEGGTLTLSHFDDTANIDVVRVTKWQDMQKLYDDLYKGNHPYKTIVIDSLTEMQKLAMNSQLGAGTALDPGGNMPEFKDWHINAQPLDEPVLTPDGWTTMGKLAAGDYVVGSHGQPTRVTAIVPKDIQPLYEVRFKDGTVVRCSDTHLWTVNSMRNKKFQTLYTRDMIELGMHHKWAPPTVSPVEFVERDLPIHPYLLGLMIADGSFVKNTISIGSVDGETIKLATQYLPDGHTLTKSGNAISAQHYLVGPTRRGNQYTPETNSVRQGLRDLGLWGHRGDTKFIPEIYMTSSVEQRLLLLQGLMDGDGSVKRHAGAQYSTISDRLALQVKELTHSLGGFSTITWQDRSHNIRVRLPDGMVPFALTRKIENYLSNVVKYERRRVIESINLVGEVDMQCIAVEASDQLYVTSGYVLTHNTEQMRRLVRAFRDLPLNTIFTALSMDAADPRRPDGPTMKKPAFTKKLAGEIPAFFDILFYMYVKETKDGPNQRLICTDKTSTVVAKCRVQGVPQILGVDKTPTMEMIYDLLIRNPQKVGVASEVVAAANAQSTGMKRRTAK